MNRKEDKKREQAEMIKMLKLQKELKQEALEDRTRQHEEKLLIMMENNMKRDAAKK